MSYINTNITSLIAQQNLGKSQHSLATAMERLSSGMRINSAKDDAAGQAIANRMTAQITGLGQAQRNANDGVSAAQTAEGALNQVNDNLQRIRELSVQAANSTNSDSDLQSIQNEITQRLNEINRISEETTFNGTKVLSEDVNLAIQVGANDGEIINVGLKEINSNSIGVGNFNVTEMMSSDNIGETAVTSITVADPFETIVTVDIQPNEDADVAADIQANSIDLSGLPQNSDVTSDGIYQMVDGAGISTGDYAVKGSDGNYYALTENEVTGQWNWDSSTAALTIASGAGVAGVDEDNGAITTIQTTVSYGSGEGTGGTVDVSALLNMSGGGVAQFFAASGADVELYRRTDVEVGYAVKGNDNNYYAVNVSATGAVTLSGGGVLADMTEVSSNNVDVAGGALNDPADEIIVGSQAAPSGDNLYNVDVGDIPTADGLYALTDGSGFAVKGSDGNYYQTAAVSGGAGGSGVVEWDSSTGPLDEALVDVAGGAVTNVYEEPDSDGLYALADGSGYVVKGDDGIYYGATLDDETGDVTWDSSDAGSIVAAVDVDESAALTEVITNTTSEATVTGLASGETLYNVLDDDGNVVADAYIVKSADSYGNVTYNEATVAIDGSNNAVVTQGDAKTVDALATLDIALNKIDELRSDLGAVQNRFMDAVTNLSTNETNLAAARSRIEDADYAVEVANMTRAQILQQAGTSVLAQANQLPQNVLSLLG